MWLIDRAGGRRMHRRSARGGKSLSEQVLRDQTGAGRKDNQDDVMKIKSLESSRIARNGLRPGSDAPLFAARLLNGGWFAMERNQARDQLLVFTDPTCGPCGDLLSELVTFRPRTPDVAIVVVTRGDRELNLRRFGSIGLDVPVLHQRGWEVGRRYGIFATPSAQLVDKAGKIAGKVAVGKRSILELLAGAQILSLLRSVEDATVSQALL